MQTKAKLRHPFSPPDCQKLDNILLEQHSHTLLLRVQNSTTQERGSAMWNRITHIIPGTTKKCSKVSSLKFTFRMQMTS